MNISKLFNSKTLVIIIIICILNSCGTFLGGTRYDATIRVIDSKDVSIFYKNKEIGKECVNIKIPRNRANKLKITLKKEGCKDFTHTFKSRSSRLVPSMITIFEVIFTARTLYLRSDIIALPICTIIDIVSGGYFKPDHKNDLRIQKVDYDHFIYRLNFPNDSSNTKTKIDSVDHANYGKQNSIELNQNTYVKGPSSMDSLQKINERKLILRDSLEKTSVIIRKAIISDTLLINEFCDDKSKVLHLSKYMFDFPHVNYPSIDSYLEVLIPNLDRLLFNPMIDSNYKEYYSRINEYLTNSGYPLIEYLEYKDDREIVRYTGMRIQKDSIDVPAEFNNVGTWRYFYENGNIKEIANFSISGVKHGLNIFFNESGEIIEYKKYIDGVPSDY